MSAAEKHGIKKISDYQHLRLRTEMYLGSRSNHSQYVPVHTNSGTTVEYLTWVPAIMTSFREIIDNSLDEFTKANIAGILDVKYLESDLLFEVSDNGRGIPIDWDSTHNCHLATLVMSELKAGRNFDDSERKGVSGMNGLGGSAVVNISSEFEVEVYRKGSPKFNNAVTPGKYHFKQRFFEGNPEFDDSLQVCEPELKTTSSSSSGTTARFQLSNHVFKHRTLPTVLVESLLREIAAVNPRHKITFNGKRLPSGTVESTLFKKKTISLHINETGFVSTFYVVPNIVAPENGVVLHSLVNNIPTYKSGNHLDTFKTHFALRLIKALEKESKRRKLKPNRSDVEEGLLIYNNTVMDCPFFGSQAKDQLINEEVIKLVDKAVSEEWLQDVIRTNKQWIDEIFQRCAERTSAKDADEVDKEARKNLRKKVAKLRDATGKRGNTYLSRAECTLFISEGDCIQEDELIKILRDSEFISIKAKDLNIGDVVITHENNLKPIINISKRVKDLKCIKTSLGEFKVSPEHRLYVQDGSGNLVFKMVKDLIPGVDRLIRSKLADIDYLDSIINISKSNIEGYPNKIELSSGKQQICTDNHQYGVFNFKDMKFEMISVNDLDSQKHAFVVKGK